MLGHDIKRLPGETMWREREMKRGKEEWEIREMWMNSGSNGGKQE